MKYTVIYEKTATGYSGYAPDLPGCIATGRTIELTKKRMEKALEMHLAAMHADGDSIPEPTTIADYVDVAGYTPSRPRSHHRRPFFIERISASAEKK